MTKIAVGRYARILNMARIDCIGKVVRHTDVGVVVRVENWTADGMARDFAIPDYDVERATAIEAREAAKQR